VEFKACLAVNLSSGLYANNFEINYCHSFEACGIKF